MRKLSIKGDITFIKIPSTIHQTKLKHTKIDRIGLCGSTKHIKYYIFVDIQLILKH